ncbi:MAG TPA: hypothetical protein VGK32_13010 [Vicinamibacterales bacterium]|jgi:hypothetical protein
MTLRRAPVAIVLAHLVAIAAGLSAAGHHPATDGAKAPSTWIESRASGVFDPATPHVRGLRVGYRVDAHILLPLGFTSLDLLSRTDVGMAVASYRDCGGEGGDLVRAFEFFSTSRPERARGIDRRGFFREAVRLTPAGTAWTAYFGAMTTWPEKTLAEARRSAEQPPSHVYEAIDGFSSALEMKAAVFQVSTDRPLANPGEFWEAVLRQLESTSPRYVEGKTGSLQKPLPSLAFLGAVQASLRSAAIHRDRPLPAPATRLTFSHNGSVRYLELASCSRKPGRARGAAISSLVRNVSDVFELRFRIINPGADDGEFLLWAELPGNVRDDPQTPPIVPLGWEMELRSYLKLVFERTS